LSTDNNTPAEQEKKAIVTRLKKIEGQIRGLQRMVLESRECSDILVQMSAVKSALKKTNRLILKKYAGTCLNKMKSGDEKDIEAFVSTMADYLDENE